VQFPMFFRVALVSIGCLGPTISCVLAQAATQSRPVVKVPKEKDANHAITPAEAESGGLTRERKLSQCLESWDAKTHMSKREWQRARERSVKDYPNPFR
jgi:hypothetical protein